jgi:hypothetical protein
MNRIRAAAALSMAGVVLTAASPAPSRPAPGCGTYLYFADGSRIESIVSDGSGKPKERRVISIRAATTAGGARAVLTTRSYTPGGKLAATTTSEAYCAGGNLTLDLSKSIGSAGAVRLRYPAAPRVGQPLEARIAFTLGDKGRTQAEFTGRRVAGTVAVNTHAGRRQAFLITSTLTVRPRILGVAIPTSFELREYLVPGLGVVRSESTQGGKLVERSVIRSVSPR